MKTVLAERKKSVKDMEEALTCMLAAAEVYRQSQNTYELSVANARITEMKAALLRLQR